MIDRVSWRAEIGGNEKVGRFPWAGVVYGMFFLTGATALVYEISWSRQIGLLFGHTVQAASVVLASYFTGMAIGYRLGGLAAARIHPLAGYGIAEWVVAVWALAIPEVLDLTGSSLFASWFSHPVLVWQTTARAVFSFLLLLPATVAMGATLPLIAGYFGNQPYRFASSPAGRDGCGSGNPAGGAQRITRAYALNTLGAFVGVLVATFWLLGHVGVRTSSVWAAAVSAGCGTLAWGLARLGLAGKRYTVGPDAEHAIAGASPLPPALLYGLSALSGFGILALQVLYTRMFSLVFHNSTYTFGVVVAVFLVSLAGGAWIVSWITLRMSPVRAIGWATGLGAVLTGLSVPVFVGLTGLDYFSWGNSFWQYIIGAMLLAGAVVGPPVVCLGMVLPALWQAAGDTGQPARDVGRLTAVNTVAAAVGAVTSSFMLLPGVGLWGAFTLVAMLFLAGNLVVPGPDYRMWHKGLAGLATGAAFTLVLSSPIEAERNRSQNEERILSRRESAWGWIDVVQNRRSGALKIRQNLHYRFGKTGSNSREMRQAHVPLLLHPHPDDVLFLGLGTGLTASGALYHGEVNRITAVELIPEVVQAVQSLGPLNSGIVDHPRAQIVVDDARHYLQATDRRFDVMISDLFVPWESETGYLYTVEHYRVSAQRLNPGGLFCQWLPLFQLGETEFITIADSFASVFPHVSVWMCQMKSTRPVIALVGTFEEQNGNAKVLGRRLNALNHRLPADQRFLDQPEQFFDLYLGQWKPTGRVRLNTDEHPRIEFLTPVTNRNRQLIRGRVFKAFFDRVLTPLAYHRLDSSPGARPMPDAARRKRARQRFILFGKP